MRGLRLLLLLMLASPVAAQDAPPSLPDFKLEPAPKPRVDPRLQGPGLTPRPTPLPAERASERPLATPPPQRPPVATPAPVQSNPPRAAPVLPARRPATRPDVRAEVRPRSQTPTVEVDRPRLPPVPAPPEVERTTPVPQVTSAPDAVPPVAETTPPPFAAPAPEPDSTAALPLGEPSRWPLLLFALAGLGVLGAASIAWRRRGSRRRGRGDQRLGRVPPEAVTPAAAPKPTQRPTPRPLPMAPVRSPTPTGPLGLAFAPLEARATALGASLRYRLTVTNQATSPATGLSLATAMAGAGPDGDAELARFRDEAPGAERVPLPDLAPGESHSVERSLRVGARDFRPIQLADRAIFVPLVGLDVSATVAGEPVRITEAHLVGRSAAPGAKMGPFRIDQGPRHYRELDGRPHALAG